MDPRQRPLLTPLATWGDKVDEKVSGHRRAADRAAEMARSEAESPTEPGLRRGAGLMARWRRLVRR